MSLRDCKESPELLCKMWGVLGGVCTVFIRFSKETMAPKTQELLAALEDEATIIAIPSGKGEINTLTALSDFPCSFPYGSGNLLELQVTNCDGRSWPFSLGSKLLLKYS